LHNAYFEYVYWQDAIIHRKPNSSQDEDGKPWVSGGNSRAAINGGTPFYDNFDCRNLA
jgi:hypothetical protein